MKARRRIHIATEHGDPVLGYEAATPHLTLHSLPAAGSQALVRGRVSSPLVLGAVLGLGTTSLLLLALLA
jgi:hypothetical protein